MIRIFLAHASEDKEEVIRLYDRLKQRGFKPWLDKKDLLAGQNWRSEIPKAIKNSDIFLACLSTQSVKKKGYVQKEFKIALDKYAELPKDAIYLIPLRLDKCEIPDFRLNEHGSNLRDIHWVDYFEPDGFEQLVKSIEFHFPETINKIAPYTNFNEPSVVQLEDKNPLVVLHLGKGNFETGLPGITVRLWKKDSSVPLQYRGSLPPAPELPKFYHRWKQLYKALHNYPTGFRGPIEFEPESLTNVSRADFRQVCQELEVQINQWLNSAGFRNIDQQLRTQLNPNESTRFIIETDDLLLQKLPWHLWKFLEYNNKAEVALSPPEYGLLNRLSSSTYAGRMRILVVLGYSDGINVQPDRLILEGVDAETVVLKEPTRSKLNTYLWDKQGWDIFFFAGHSTNNSEGHVGKFFLNADEQLSVKQLKHALQASIQHGLKLAIFNSCDGLGLARDLADLNLPQLIVMREPVVDQVAQTFLQNFLRVFSDGEPFYTAVRHAREQLQGIEGKFPCASWLPVIFQNPTEMPITWRKVSRGQ